MAYTIKEFEKLITAQEKLTRIAPESAEKVKKFQEAAAKEGARLRVEKELLGRPA